MGQYDDDECTLSICFHHDAAKHGCDYLDTVNRTWCHLKKGHFAIRAPRIVVDHTINDVPVCVAALRLAAAMISELRVHAAAYVVDLFVQILVVLQTTLILNSGLVTWLHDPLSQCG
ncbi:hypothetical protein TNCV_2975151 [Trichonephila clavipes]|nr:hypothetical protein TNCV_2975151 [Trichonephila clavipes]